MNIIRQYLLGSFFSQRSLALYCLILIGLSLPINLSASPLSQLVPASALTHAAMIQVSYGLAALATLGLAFLAFGKEFKWRWLIALIGSLALIAVSGQIVGTSGTAGYVEAPATATGNGQLIFDGAQTLTARTSNSAKYIAYGIAGIGVIGLATFAILGKWRWPWAWGIIGGLLVIAMFPDLASLIDRTYETGDVLVPDTGRDGFADAATLAGRTSSSLRYIVYSAGALGMMGLAALAFVGRFQWRWFFMIIGGLGLGAGSYQIIEYLGVTG